MTESNRRVLMLKNFLRKVDISKKIAFEGLKGKIANPSGNSADQSIILPTHLCPVNESILIQN